MSLRKCPDCGNDVSSTAVACPHCGRPTRRSSSPVELSGILIIAVVCAGGLIWHLSTQYQGPTEPAQTVAPETRIAQPTRDGPGLTARIGYNRKLFLFRVENGDSFAWRNCQLSLNAQGISSGYARDLAAIQPGIADAPLVESAEFVDADGRHFDPATQQVDTLGIACETPHGRLAYGGKF